MLKFVTFSAALTLTTAASAVPNHGLQWRTVGDPGNVPTDPAMYHPFFPRPLGAVDYTYRLSLTEVTAAQQLEFLNAYGPHMAESDLRSWGPVNYFGMGPSGPVWQVIHGQDQHVGAMSARLWQRYSNWLHNDKALTADAFESGAYDTSTFGVDENGDRTDQKTRSEGARFWIPSVDEWIKGGYWDPNRYGEGEGGYWLYANGSDTPSMSGHPYEGGETNAGFSNLPRDVGSYPDTQTPWGLLDYSGGGGDGGATG